MMQIITDSVGEKGANAVHDAALVQAILLKIPRAVTATQREAQYLTSYDGVCGKNTIAAIKAFQNDFVFVNNATQQSVPNPNATAGLVKADDATWKALLAQVPEEFKNLRVLNGGKTVYVEATADEKQAKITALSSLTFTTLFRDKVASCINEMHRLHGIALGVCRAGDRRTFQKQFEIRRDTPANTNAGPGESNHNFGMATDIGFGGLRWLHTDGTVEANETCWLHKLDPNQKGTSAEANRFWDAQRAVGTSATVSMFRGPAGDRPHLQNWDDSRVKMKERLAVHLQNSGKMKWSLVSSAYACDLGYGGKHYSVGTAMKIWDLDATVTAANIDEARAEAHARALKALPKGTPPPPAPAKATAADVTAMKQLLREDFDAADTNWQNWTPS
jgi:hypothetical protein